MLRSFRVLVELWRHRYDDPATPSGPPPPLDECEQSRRRQRGQSLIEYSILLTWMTLASIGIIHGITTSTKGIWTTTNATLTNASTTSGS